jgi:uncharacterized protein
MKYLLVLLVAVVGIWLLLRQRSAPRPPAAPRGTRPPAGTRGPLPMLACAHCDLRLPANEAWADDHGRPYCSEAHRAAGPKA